MICRGCKEGEIELLMDFCNQPIVHNLLNSATSCSLSYPLEIGVCTAYGLLQIIRPIPASKLYENYFTLSSWKNQPHVDRLIWIVQNLVGISHQDSICEIGCNDGSFLESLKKAGYQAGNNIYIALDVAASELYKQDKSKYELASENLLLSSNEMIEYYYNLCNKYPIISIEDGLDEEDWKGWRNLFSKLGTQIQIVGDDLTVTNPQRLQRAIDKQAINAILIKLNQIGTITETIDTIQIAKQSKLGAIISHRSGETEDTTISDLSVAMGVGQIKTGSMSRTDRTSKYNQLLRIEEELKHDKVSFANINFLGNNLK